MNTMPLMQMPTEYMLKVVALPVFVEPFKISKQAQSLGCIRKEIWQRFDSINGVGIKHRSVRSDWLKQEISNHWQQKHGMRLYLSHAAILLAEASESVSKARGSCLRLVNCAYTSQMDSNTCRLEGRREGDKFYHVNGGVSQVDTNAAVNIKHRGDDAEITL